MDAAVLRSRLTQSSRDEATIRPPPETIGMPLVPAAVLVLIVLRDEPSVLLTKRTGALRSHAGQVSFPGGRIDPDDHGAEAAALREAAEEIDLDPTAVELCGRLADHVTGSGYRITPVIGLLPSRPTLHPAPAEVECVFYLPLAILLDPAGPRRQRALHREQWREFWVWPHDEHYIWGATAAILLDLADRLRD